MISVAGYSVVCTVCQSGSALPETRFITDLTMDTCHLGLVEMISCCHVCMV